MLLSMFAIGYLGVLALIDARKRMLSGWVLALGGIAAVLCAGYLLLSKTSSFESLLFGAVPGMLLLALAVLTKGIGIGDGLVLLQLCAFLRLESILSAFALSLLIMGAFSLVLLVAKKANKDLRLPYLPFLWIGCVGALLFCG